MTRPFGLLSVLFVALAADPARSEQLLRDILADFRVQVDDIEKIHQPSRAQRGLEVAPASTGDYSQKETISQIVPFEAFPWQVALVLKDIPAPKGYFCGGVLIATNWVLTTAHCVAAVDPGSPIESEFQILSGTDSLAEGGERYEVERILTHPDWDPATLENDIALVRVSTPIDGVAISLPQASTSVDSSGGKIGQVVGWGSTVDNGSISESLLLLGAEIVTRDGCNGPAFYGGLVTDGAFCARSLTIDEDACQGFGGSPLILNEESGERYLRGLVSWGQGCPPVQSNPSVYTDVAWHVEWIRKNVQ